MNELESTLKRMIDKRIPVSAKAGKVTKVNADYTCSVEPADGGATYHNVRLRAIVDNNQVGILPKPKVGSWVLFALINNNENDAYVMLYEELDEVLIKCDNIKLNGDQYNGLVKVDDLVQVLNNIINRFNNHNHTVPGVQPGSGTATAKPTVSPLTTVQRSTLENNTVKHG